MEKWMSKSLCEFNNQLGSESPTPGGGAAASVMASISAALLLMVVDLSPEDSGLKEIRDDLKEWLSYSHELIDEDCEGYQYVVEALNLSGDNDEEMQKKRRELEKSYKKACHPPEKLLEVSLNILKSAGEIAEKGNENAWTETVIAGMMSFNAVKASYYNVILNCCYISDDNFSKEKVEKAQKHLQEAKKLNEELESYLHEEVIKCEYL